PVVTILDGPAREELARDLVVRALAERPDPQAESTLVDRVNEQRVAGRVSAATVRRQLEDLEATGHVDPVDKGWVRTTRAYTESEVDRSLLEALVGSEVHAALASAGFRGVGDLVARADELRERSADVLGLAPETGDLLVE